MIMFRVVNKIRNAWNTNMPHGTCTPPTEGICINKLKCGRQSI